MKTNGFLSQPDIPQKVIHRLKEYSDLPPTGIIAGGSIANIILSLAHGGNYPLNDIDVFRAVENDMPSSKTMPHRHDGMDIRPIAPGYQELSLFDREDRAYTVVESRKEGMINDIDILMMRNYSSDETAQIIIECFDLNCCQAALNLESGKLIYTEAFEEFLRTMQLQVTTVYTPYHTSIRLPKKQLELNCYCNYDNEMSLLSQVPQVFPRGDYKDNRLWAGFFGEKYLNIYHAHKPILDKYYVLEDDREKFPWMHNNKIYALRPLMPVVAILRECKSPAHLKIVWDLIHGKKQSVVRKNRRLLEYDKPLKYGLRMGDFAAANPNYATCDWNYTHLDCIAAFLEKHPDMSILFSEMRLSIQQQLNAIRIINRMVKREGHFIIGLLVNAQLEGNEEVTESWIYSLIDNYKSSYPGLLKQREDISHFKYADCISELVTVKELMAEGKRMHHCVGGYARGIRDHGYMIFHIEAKGESSTVALCRHTTPNRLGIFQHRSKWNNPPANSHEEIARELCDYIDSGH